MYLYIGMWIIPLRHLLSRLEHIIYSLGIPPFLSRLVKAKAWPALRGARPAAGPPSGRAALGAPSELPQCTCISTYI